MTTRAEPDRRRTASGAVLLTATLATVVALAVSSAPPAAAAGPARTLGTNIAVGPGPTVLVLAVPDLRWTDVSAQATPAIWRLVGAGSAGVVSVKSAYQRAGCADGLLTLGAGDRLAAEAGSAPPVPCTDPSAAQVAELTRRRSGAPDAGALAAALRSHGLRTAALGAGAELALPGATVTAPLTAGASASAAADVAVAVDDAVYRSTTAQQRATAVRSVDAVVAGLVDPLPATTTVLLVGSSDRPGEDAHLHVAVARGPGFGPGWLSSPSTERAPYVELVDVAPTVLGLAGAPTPSGMIGRPWRAAAGPADPGTRVAALADLDVKAVQGARWRPLFMWCLALVALLVTALGLLAAGRPRLRPGLEVAAWTVAALPIASWLVQLVPWWRWSLALLPVLLLAVAAAVGAAAAALARGRPAHGLLLVSGVSAVVLGVDLLTHSRLQTAALLGDSPITAGRFYGAGNTAFGVLAAAALLGAAVACTAPVTHPPGAARVRGIVAGLLVLPAAVVDAAPTLGADLGGALALLPSTLVLMLLVARIRLTVRRVAAALLAGVVPLLLLAGWDYHRPADRRTHIGRFVAQVFDGQAGPVVGRKLAANLGQLVASPFLPLVVGGVVVAVVAWRRHRGRLTAAARSTPGLGPGVVAVTFCAVVGGLVNDSGVTVTGIMLAVTLPMVTALALRADPPPDP